MCSVVIMMMNKEKLEILKTKYGTWKNVAAVLNVSTRTIRYWRSDTYKPCKKHKENITKKSKYNYKKHRKTIERSYKKKVFKFYKSKKYGTKTRRIEIDNDISEKRRIRKELKKIDDVDVYADRNILHSSFSAKYNGDIVPIGVSMDATNLTYDQMVENIRKVARGKAWNKFGVSGADVEIHLEYCTIEYTKKLR